MHIPGITPDADLEPTVTVRFTRDQASVVLDAIRVYGNQNTGRLLGCCVSPRSRERWERIGVVLSEAKVKLQYAIVRTEAQDAH